MDLREPRTSCRIIDKVLEAVEDALRNIGSSDDPEQHVRIALWDVEDYLEEIRGIASTLREQRAHFLHEVEELEEEVERLENQQRHLQEEIHRLEQTVDILHDEAVSQ